MRPRDVDRQDIPGLAVAAVIRLAADRDPAAITLAEVAAAAGCKAPALYRYFHGKAALLRAAQDEGFRRLNALKAAADAEAAGDPVERLRLGGLAYVRFALTEPALYRLMFGLAPAAEDGGAATFARDPARQALAALREAVEAAQAATGRMDGQDPSDIAFLLWASAHGIAALILQGRTPYPRALPPGEALALAERCIGMIVEAQIR